MKKQLIFLTGWHSEQMPLLSPTPAFFLITKPLRELLWWPSG